MEHITYTPQGVCSRQINIDHENGKIVAVNIVGGCNGNLKGISQLLIGMEVNEVINRLSGIKCGMRQTSCPDQIANALKNSK